MRRLYYKKTNGYYTFTPSAVWQICALNFPISVYPFNHPITMPNLYKESSIYHRFRIFDNTLSGCFRREAQRLRDSPNHRQVQNQWYIPLAMFRRYHGWRRRVHRKAHFACRMNRWPRRMNEALNAAASRRYRYSAIPTRSFRRRRSA